MRAMDSQRDGLSSSMAVQEDACVLDPGRACRACLAASPRECPYLYLLGGHAPEYGRNGEGPAELGI